MSATIASTPRPTREPRNGVNTPVLLATINAVKETPALAKFRFRASNRWVDGTYSESRVESFTGAGANTPIRPSSATVPIIPPCSSARIVVRRPSNSSCTDWLRASPQASATSPRSAV